MSKHSFFTGLSKNTFLLTFTSFFADISTEMLYPVLPLFLTSVLGVNAEIVGLIEGIATATQNIVQGFSGWIADKLHNRKRVALVGYTLAALGKPLMGVATIWQGVLLGRFIDRFGTGTRSAPRDALIAASASEENRGKAFGLEGIGDNAGAFVGPLVAIALLFIFHIPLRSIFFFALIPGFLAIGMILLVSEKAEQAKTHIKISLTNFPVGYYTYLFVTLLFGLGTASTSFFILQTQHIGTSYLMTILIYAFFNLAAALISYPAGNWSDTIGRKTVLLSAFFIFFVVCVGFAVSKNIIILGLLFLLLGSYQGIFRAVGKSYATDFVPSEHRASAVGWYSTVVGLSSLVASIIAGWLWVTMSPSAAFFYGAVCACLGIAALLTLLKK